MAWKDAARATILACCFALAAGVANATVIDYSNSSDVSPGVAVGDGAAWDYSLPSGTFIPNEYADFEVDSAGTYTVSVTGDVFLFSLGTSTGFFDDGLSIGAGDISAALVTGVDYFVYVSAVSSPASGTINVASPASAVPEPSTWVILLTAVGCVIGLMRHRRKTATFAAAV